MKSKSLACLVGTATLAAGLCVAAQGAVTAAPPPPVESAATTTRASDANYLGMSIQIFNDSSKRITLKNLHASHTLVIEPGSNGWMERKGQVETDLKFVVTSEGRNSFRVDANNPNMSWPNIKLTKSSDWWSPHDEFKRFSVDETWDLNFHGYGLKFKRYNDDASYKRFSMRLS